MNKIELLAPAGSNVSVVAAVQNGADAVYFGTEKFNARANAENMGADTIEGTIGYCHARGVKAYLALNTLIKQRELDQALELALFVYGKGIDAMIVADLGLAQLILQHAPNAALHASTQMTIHDAQGAIAAKKLGFSRVVLARELHLSEIRRVQEVCDFHQIETEVFVHGAMCVSVSGQCLFSSMVGERSGNRGVCAQPCRLKYQMPNQGKSGYLLSMKDLCALQTLQALADIGVTSVKIEGRMKRFDYVAHVVAAYRVALDGKQDLLQEESKLRRIFSRGGFSSGYLFGAQDQELIEPCRPGHWGIEVGEIAKNGAELIEKLYKGDIIATRAPGQEEDVTLKITQDLNIGKVLLNMQGAQGQKIFKISDAALYHEAVESMKGERRKSKIRMHFTARLGEACELEIYHEKAKAKVYGSIVQPAQKVPTTAEKLTRSLLKLSDWCFTCEETELVLDIDDPIFLPVSAINQLRRRGLETLIGEIIQLTNRPKISADSKKRSFINNVDRSPEQGRDIKPMLIAQTTQIAQAQAAIDAGAEMIYAQERMLNRQNITDWNKFAKQSKVPVYLSMPPVVFPSQEKIMSQLLDLCDGFSGAVAGSIGQIAWIKTKFKHANDFKIIGDYTLNILNPAAQTMLMRMGLQRTTLSVELNTAQLKDMISICPSSEIIVYGALPLMNLRNCPIRNAEKCAADCQLGTPVIDRKGYEFTLLPMTYEKNNCLIQLLNSKKLDGQITFNALLETHAQAWRLLFHMETVREVSERTAAYKDALRGKGTQPLPGATSGAFKRNIQ